MILITSKVLDPSIAWIKKVDSSEVSIAKDFYKSVIKESSKNLEPKRGSLSKTPFRGLSEDNFHSQYHHMNSNPFDLFSQLTYTGLRGVGSFEWWFLQEPEKFKGLEKLAKFCLACPKTSKIQLPSLFKKVSSENKPEISENEALKSNLCLLIPLCDTFSKHAF